MQQQYRKWKSEDFPPAQRGELEQYANWLKIQSQRYSSHGQDQEIFDYKQIADQTFTVGEKQIHPYAPFRIQLSALRTITAGQYTLLGVLVAVLALCLGFFGLATLSVLCALCVLLYTFHLCTLAYALLRPKGIESVTPIDDKIVEALDGADWPTYTILCPLYKEAKIVPQYVRAMLQLDYPKDKLQVLFLLEEDDKETHTAMSLLSLPAFCAVVSVPTGSPRTKPRACNYGLMFAKGQYCVIYDAEDVPQPSQLKKAVLTFAQHGPEVACVQASLNFYNTRQSLLTRFFTIEYSVWFDMILPALSRIGIALPLGGTSNHFQTTYLRALGGWDSYNVTEDCDLGMRLAQYGLKTAMLSSTTYEEATANIGNWLRQRSRWIKGYMQTFLVQTRHPTNTFRKKSRIKTFFSLQWIIGVGTVIFFINPLMWAMFFVYLFFRSHVEGIYHILFPAPVLYLGTLCLIFGNLFCLYVAMIACMNRERYELVKWCLLLPVYWLLISAAAVKGLFQLITKPHYWEKTRHGTHIAGKDPDQAWKETSNKIVALAKEDTAFHSAVTTQDLVPVEKAQSYRAMRSVTEEILAMPTVQSAAITKDMKKAKHTGKKVRIKDYSSYAVILLAIILSVSFTTYSFLHQDILLYNDAYSHMRIARAVIDSATPGFGQLGTVWLPLPHLIMLPFIWNDWLWKTGLAGSISSMICYIIAAIFLFFSCAMVTGNRIASFIGVLVFLTNPNVLYLQTTPLSEPVCFAAFSATAYFFLLWGSERKYKYLILTAIFSFLATLARYDGWVLFGSVVCLMLFIDIRQRKSWKEIQSDILIFCIIGGLGIVLWFAWNKVIFGNALYFQQGPYSSQDQMQYFYPNQVSILKHNIVQDIRYYVLACYDTIGILVSTLSVIGLAAFFLKERLSNRFIASVAFLSPLLFYAISFYTGQVVILVPGVSNDLFNARFGTESVLPASFFVAMCLGIFASFFKRNFTKNVLYLLVGIVLVAQSFFIFENGIISLEDGQYGQSCYITRNVNIYLSQHYNGGTILEDTYLESPDESQVVGIHFRNIIYSGSNQVLSKALKNPSLYVDWVIVGVRNADARYPMLIDVNSKVFKNSFSLVAFGQSTNLYVQKRLISKLPKNPIPDSISSTHLYCFNGKYPGKGNW